MLTSAEICTSPDNIATGNKTIMSMCILSVLSDVVSMFNLHVLS